MVVIAYIQEIIPLLSLGLLIFIFIYTSYTMFCLLIPILAIRDWHQTGIDVVSDVISTGNYDLLYKDYGDCIGWGLLDFISDEVILVTTSFRNANLTDADFSYSISYETDFYVANLTRTNFKNTKYAVTRSDLVNRFHPRKEKLT